MPIRAVWPFGIFELNTKWRIKAEKNSIFSF